MKETIIIEIELPDFKGKIMPISKHRETRKVYVNGELLYSEKIKYTELYQPDGHPVLEALFDWISKFKNSKAQKNSNATFEDVIKAMGEAGLITE